MVGGPNFVDSFFLILASTVFVNNFVLTQFLGLCPLFGASKQMQSAIGMSFATTFVLTFASLFSWLIDHYLLLPFDVGHLRIITFIAVIAAFVQVAEMFTRALWPLLHQVLGLFLPLITTNCAVLGAMLLNSRQDLSLIETVIHGFGTAVGFSLVLILFTALQGRISATAVPAPFQGAAIQMVTVGLMSLAMMGFKGFA